MTQVFGIESQNLTDVLKREKPIPRLVQDPLLRLVEKLLSSPALCQEIFLEAINGIVQDSQHEALLWLQESLSTKILKILSGQKCIRLKKGSDFLVYAETCPILWCIENWFFPIPGSPCPSLKPPVFSRGVF